MKSVLLVFDPSNSAWPFFIG